MMLWQARDCGRVIDRHAQRPEATAANSGRKPQVQRLRQRQSAGANFDGHLPGACRAHTNVWRVAFDRSAGADAEFRTTQPPPEERLRIEQQIHFLTPNVFRMSSGRGASKSSLIQIRPVSAPK